MAQATAETTAPGRPGGGTGKHHATVRPARDPRTGRLLPKEPVLPETPVVGGAALDETPVVEQPEIDETTERIEAAAPEIPGHEDPELPETPEDEEDDAQGETETPASRQALIAQRTTHERTKALLAEALRLGLSQGLIERRQDGSFALPGDVRPPRLTSDCECQACSPQNQRHWWCVVCGSGPHDWLMNKPQYERQTLKPGGIEGARQAACSGQCAKDFLQSLGRQPGGVTPRGQTIDPTLALP